MVVAEETASGRNDDVVLVDMRTTRSSTEEGLAARHATETAKLKAQLDALNAKLYEAGRLRIQAEQGKMFAEAGLEAERIKKVAPDHKRNASLKKMFTDALRKHCPPTDSVGSAHVISELQDVTATLEGVVASAATAKASTSAVGAADAGSAVTKALAREDVHRLELKDVHRTHNDASERALMAVLELAKDGRGRRHRRHRHRRRSVSRSSSSSRSRDNSRSRSRSRGRGRRRNSKRRRGRDRSRSRR
jgi:hypothetical protein